MKINISSLKQQSNFQIEIFRDTFNLLIVSTRCELVNAKAVSHSLVGSSVVLV